MAYLSAEESNLSQTKTDFLPRFVMCLLERSILTKQPLSSQKVTPKVTVGEPRDEDEYLQIVRY